MIRTSAVFKRAEALRSLPIVIRMARGLRVVDARGILSIAEVFANCLSLPISSKEP